MLATVRDPTSRSTLALVLDEATSADGVGGFDVATLAGEEVDARVITATAVASRCQAGWIQASSSVQSVTVRGGVHDRDDTPPGISRSGRPSVAGCREVDGV